MMKVEQEHGEIILVGLARNPMAASLAERLTAAGLRVRSISGVDGLPTLLDAASRAAILVYDSSGQDIARRVLAHVRSRHRATPVIVLADRVDWGEYHTLMEDGAVEYFEISETPDLIVRGVEWAAYRLAS